tara:strand:- start:2244 stop:4883 length:2640 start_codon:yes stop_codon:yes gene_type:complete
MGLLNINNGVSQKKGINYTVIIDNINDDFGDVSNDTYFLDNETQLVYYKNTTGGLVSIFEQGGSGNTIYSSDDSLSEDRTVSVGTNTLTFSTDNGSYKLLDVGGTVERIQQRLECSSSSTKSTEIALNVGGFDARFSMYGTSARTDLANKTFLVGGYNHGPFVVQNTGGSDNAEIWLSISNGSTADGTISKRRAKITKDDFKIHNVTGFIYHPTDDEPTKIGTENVSLQGDTLISKKLELSTTTDGFLMPRLTTAEKNAISSPVDTNLMLFDTTLNAFQRYNGSAWVNVVNSDTIYTADDNLAGNRTINLNNKVLKFETSTSGGGIGIGNSAAGALTTTMTILPTSAHTRVLNILKSNTDGLACFQPDGIIFNSPSNSKIGTEDISLQGDTLISEKLTLSATDHGILLNRVTDSQMAGITGMLDNEIVFNIDKNALYRYDSPTTNWVALAAGYGMVGVVRDSDNGNPAYFSDLQSALDTCKTVGSYNTVTLYSNITTTLGIIIDSTFDYKNLTINFNGFKIENTQADATHTLDITNLVAGATTVLLDGSLIRENGTTGKCVNYNSTTRNIQMSKMYLYNENYMTLQLGGSGEVYDFGGSIFETGPSATLNTVRLSYDKFKNFTAISNSSIGALFLTNGAKATNFTVINKSTGVGITTQTSCIASNFYAESNSGNAVGGGIFSNFVAKSVSGIAVNSPSEAHDFVATTGDNIAVNIGAGENFSNFRAENNSSTNACVYMSNTEECVQVYAKNKGSGYAIHVYRNQPNRSFSYNKITAISDGGIAANLSSNPGFKILFSHCEFVSKWNDVGGHSVRIGGNDTVLTNCSFRVNNVGANNITSDSVITTKVTNSTFDGATTPINTNVTLSNPFTSDPYGNVTL